MAEPPPSSDPPEDPFEEAPDPYQGANLPEALDNRRVTPDGVVRPIFGAQPGPLVKPTPSGPGWQLRRLWRWMRAHPNWAPFVVGLAIGVLLLPLFFAAALLSTP